MTTRTATALILEARQRADQEKSTGFTDDAEVLRYLNAGLQAVYDLMVAAYGNDYFYEEFSASMATGESVFALPAGFYKLLGIDYAISAGQVVALKPYTRFERNRWRASPYYTYYGPYYEYRVQGNDIHIIPDATGALALTVLYVPTMPLMRVQTFANTAVTIGADTLTIASHGFRAGQPLRFTPGPEESAALMAPIRADTDYFTLFTDKDTIQLAETKGGAAIDLTDQGTGTHHVDTVFDGINGWEAFATLDAGVQMLNKEESDASAQITEREILRQRLVGMADDRDAAMPARVNDVRRGQGYGYHGGIYT